VWVRVAGEWRKGRLVEWVTYIGSEREWEAVISAENPQDPPWSGRYVYDGKSIRPRHDDVEPGE